MKEKLDKIELAQIYIMNRIVSGMSNAIETSKTFENDKGMRMYERGVYDGYVLAFNIILREFDDADLHEYAFGIDDDRIIRKANTILHRIFTMVRSRLFPRSSISITTSHNYFEDARDFSVTKRTVNRTLTIVKYLIDDEINYTFADCDEGIVIGTLTESRDLDNVPFWRGIIDTYFIMIDDDDDLIRQFENDSFFLHRFGLRFDSVILLDQVNGIGKAIK